MKRIKSISLVFALLLIISPALAFGQMSGEFIDDGAGGTIVILFGPDVPSSAATVTVGVDALTGVTVVLDTMTTENPNDYVLDGLISQPIGDFSAGNYTVVIDTLTFNAVPFTIGGGGPAIDVTPTSYDFGMVDVGNFAEYTFTISNPGDQQLDVTSFNFSPAADFSVQTTMPINVAPGGSENLVVRFSPTVTGGHSTSLELTNNAPANPNFNVSLEGTGESATPAPDIWGGDFMEDGTQTKVEIRGTNIPNDLTSVSVGGYTVSSYTVEPDSVNPQDQVIRGTIAQDISTFSEGDYTVDFTSATEGSFNFTDIWFMVYTGPGLEIWGGDFMEDGTQTKVEIRGTNIPNDLTSVSVGGYTVSSFTVEPDSMNPQDQVIRGTIAQDISIFSEGDYTVEIISTSEGSFNFTDIWFMVYTGPGLEIWGGDFMEDGTQTKVEIRGTNIPSDLTSVSVGGYTVSSFTVDPDSMNPQDQVIRGTIVQDISIFSEGNYTVDFTSTTEGTFNFTNIWFMVYTGPGLEIWGGDFMEDDTQTQVEIWGTNIPSDLTSVSVGGYTVSSFTVEPDSMNPQDQVIRGTIAQDISIFSEDNYTVEINSTSEGTFNFTDIWFMVYTGPGLEIWGGDFMEDGTQTKVEIRGTNIPSDLTSVSVGGYTVSSFTVEPDSMNPQDQVIRGTIAQDISTFSEGDYTVDFTSTTEGTFNFPDIWFMVNTGPGLELWGGDFMEDGTQTKVEIRGTNIPNDLTSVSVGGYTVNSFTVEPDSMNPQDQVIRGTIAQDISNFSEGNYTVDFISTTEGTFNFPDIWFMVNTGPGLEIWGGDFMEDGTQTKVEIRGTNIPNDLTSVSVGGYTVNSFTVEPDSMNPQDQVIRGTIAQDISTFSEGDYTVEINSTSEGTLTFTDIWFMVFIHGTQIWGGHFAPDGSQTMVEIFGKEIPTDLTSVSVGTYAVNNIVVEPDSMMPDEQVIRGTIAQDITTFSEDNYTVEIISTSEGSFNFTDIWFTVQGSGGNIPNFWGMEFIDDGSSQTRVIIYGDNFVSGDITNVEVADNNIFNGGFNYSLSGITVDVDWESGSEDKIEGTMPVAISSINSGNYYIRLTSNDYGTIISPDPGFWFDGAGAITVTNMNIMPTPEGTGTEFWVYGDGFSSGNITGLEIWFYDSGIPILLYSYTADSIFISSPNDFRATENIGTSSLQTGDYFARVYTTIDTLDTPVYNFAGGGGGPWFWGAEFSPDSAGFTFVTLWGSNLPMDINSVTISDTTGFNYSLIDITMGQDPQEPNDYKIEGIISVDFSNITEGCYDISANSLSEGELSFFDIWFSVQTGGGPMVNFEWSDFEPDSENSTDFIVSGQDFEDLGTISSIEVYTEPSYSGTYFTVENIQLVLSETSEDNITGTIPGSITQFAEGEYWVRILTNIDEFTYSFYYYPDPGNFPDFYWAELHPGAGTETVLSVFGDGFENISSVTSIEISQDSTFTGPYYFTYTGIYTNPTDEDTLTATIAQDISSFPEGEYFGRIATDLGEFRFMFHHGAGPHGPGIFHLEIYEFESQTTVRMFGGGLDQSDIISIEISMDSTFTTGVLPVAGFVINAGAGYEGSDEIMGTLTADIGSFTEDDYWARVTTTSMGVLPPFGPFYHPTGPQGPQIFYMEIYEDMGQTWVRMFSGGFSQADITSLEISMDGTFTTGVLTVSGISVSAGAGYEGSDEIVGVLPVDINTLSEGDHWVRITTPTDILPPFGPFGFYSGPMTGEGIWHFSMHPDMGYIEIYVETEDIPLDSIVSIEISLDQTFTTGSIYTVTNLEFEPEEGWEGSDLIYGIVYELYKTFPAGDYYIRITMAAGDPYIWGMSQFPPDYVPTPPPLSEITFSELSFIHYRPDTAAVIIYGEKFFGLEFETGVAIQLSDNASFTGNVYNLIVDEIEDEHGGRGFIVGLYPTVVTNFPAGDYYVKITVPGESPILSEALTAPAGYIPSQPVIYPVGSIFRGYRPGRTGFGVPGDLFDTITITSIEVSSDQTFATGVMTVDSIEVMPNEHGFVDEVIGVIHVDMNDIPTGNYYVRITHSTGSMEGGPFLFVGVEGPPLAPDVVDLTFMEGGTGQTDLDIVGYDFDPSEITGVQVSQDGGFTGTGSPVYILTGVNVHPGMGFEGADLITGLIPVDLSSLLGGDYYVKVLSMSSGEHIFGPFYYEAGGGTKPEFFCVGIGAEGLDASIDIQGENFDIFPPGAITSWRFTKDDSTFSGSTTIYEVTNITVEVNPDSDDRIFGIITELDPMTLEKGNYYAELTITGSPSPILIPFYFSLYGPPMFFNIDLFDEGTTTRVEMFGENLAQIDTADIYSMMMINDSTLANATIVWDVTDYYIVSYPDSIEKIVGYISGLSLPTLPQGDYWISVSAQCLIDADFPDPTVYPFYWNGSGTGQIEVNNLNIIAGPDNTTEFWVYGSGFTSSNTNRIEIWFNSGITDVLLYTFYTGDLNISPNSLKGVQPFDFSTLSSGNYWAKVYSDTDYPIEAPSMHIENGPLEPEGEGIWRFDMFPKFGYVGVFIETKDIPLDSIVSIEVSLDSAFTAGSIYSVTNLELESGAGWEGADEIEGLINELYAAFPAGDYYVKITMISGDPYIWGTSVFPPDYVPEPPPVSSITFSKLWFVHYGTDTTLLIIEGENLFGLHFVTGVTVQVSDNAAFTGNVYDLTLEDIEGEEGGYNVIVGLYPMAASNFAAGDYYVKITVPGDPSSPIVSGALPTPAGYVPAQPIIYTIGTIFRGGIPGRTGFGISGDLFDTITITSVEISADSNFATVLWTVDSIEVIPEDYGTIDMIEGIIYEDISNIPVGDYYVRLTHSTGTIISGPFAYYGHPAGPAEPEYFGVGFEPISVNDTKVYIFGSGFDQIPAITSVRISPNSNFTESVYYLTDISVNPKTGEPDEITGIIPANISSLTAGVYFIEVVTTESSNTFELQAVGQWQGVLIARLEMFEHEGITRVYIKGNGFDPAEITAIAISSDNNFTPGGIIYQVEDFTVFPDVGPRGGDFIEGFINISPGEIGEGIYYVRLTTISEGDIYSDGLQYPPPPQFEIHFMDMFISGAVTGVEIFGENFDLESLTYIHISMDPAFAGGAIYTVENVVLDLGAGPNGTDKFSGTIDVPFESLAHGEYFVKFVTSSGGEVYSHPIQFPFPWQFFYQVHHVELFQGLEPGIIDILIHGEGFEPENIFSVEIAPDSLFTGMVYPVSIVNVTSYIDESDVIDGTIAADASVWIPGTYYVRLNTSNGVFIRGPYFIAPPQSEPTIFMAALVPGLIDGRTILLITGENFEGIDLSDITFDVSQDSSFSGEPYPIYPVTGFRKFFEAWQNDRLTGIIEVDFETLPFGDYYLRITSAVEGVVGKIYLLHKGQPKIMFSPNFLDFGLVSIGERDSMEVTIRNDGNDTLRVFSIFSSPSFHSTLYQLPEILPGDSVKNTIVFEPHYGATYRDTIWFGSNDLLRPFAPLFVRGKSTIMDITPPVFLEYPRAVGLDTSSVTIVFKTDEPTRAEVIYWEASYIGTEIIATGQQAIPDTHVVVIDSVFSMWHEITLTDLSLGTGYSFIVSITDILENSPTFSQASFFQTRALADIIPPVITKAPIFYLIDTSTVMINWHTDEIATSMIRYNPGDTLTAEEWNVIQPEFENMHEILLEGLTPDTIYSYQVGSEDVHGNGPTVSGIRHFYTLARPDIEPPNFIEQPQVIGVDTSNALIRFLTDEQSNTVIYYNIDSLFYQGIWLEYVDSLYVKWHRAVLSGLFPGTSYTFLAQTTDRNGNGPSESYHYNFKTKDMADTRPPVFLGFPTVIAKDTSSITIGWATDEISTSVIEYEMIENFDSTRIRIEDPTLTKEHILTITNLMSATKYVFIIRSVDAQGNEAVINRTFEFMTALIIDREAPVIFGKPYVAEKDTDRVVIKWETNERATSIVEILIDTLFEDTAARTILTDLELTRFHSVSVFGLTPNTLYAFRVGSEDGFGNGPIYSEPQIVKTLDIPDIFPPVIFGFPEVRIVDTSTVAIRWKTNEISSRRVVYYAEGSEENVNIQEEQALSREGVVILSDLIPATKYLFTVFSTDSKGNTSRKGPFEFTTPARADMIPPAFMRFPAIANIDTSSFVIEWITDENANAILEYFLLQYAGDDPSDTLTVDDQTLQLRHSIYVSGLAPGTQYQVRVLSFDQAGNGPLTSEWFTIRTRNLPDLTPPRILGFPVVMKTDTSSATLAWLTDEPASSEIEYALASQWSVNNLMEMISEFSRTNEITLTNLLPDSLYFYRIRLTDRFGNVSEFSPLYRFRTLALADIIPPAFVGLVHITEIDTNKATIRWRTNEASNSIVEIGIAEEYPDNTWMVVEQELTENHAVLIKDLTSDTRYIIRVRSTDANENTSEFSPEFRFKTLAIPDTKPPVILGQPTERDIDTTSVTIIFGTDEPATSRIEVREANDTTKTFLFLDGELVRLHRTFVSGLSPNTEYEYRVSATDVNNNGPTVSGYQRFRTRESADITPPRVISGPIVIGLTHHSATIKFITNEVSYVSVSFGTDITLGTTVSELQGKTTHTIRLNNLADSTLYYYQLEGKDIKGNEFIYPPVEQGRLSFRTKPMPAVQDVSKPKIIAGPVELDIEPYQMTILWQTDKLANSVVDFGNDTTLGETVTQDNETMVHRHRVRLTNLIADTTYYYRIKSRGANNMEFVSNLFIVHTPALPDTLPAIIVQGPIVTFLGSDNATIEWLTDKNSSSRVDFGVDHESLVNLIKEDEIEGVKRHQIKLTGLFPDTIYYYQVSSIAANGREVVSSPFSFRTLADVDLLPPKFLAGPDATAIENTSATIEWITDELSTSKVEYGLRTPGAVNLTEVIYVDADAAGVIKHKAVLTELTPGTLYIFCVSSTDLSPERNEAVSRVKRFKTIAIQDTIPPHLLTGPIVDFSDRTAVFEWETDELSDSFVLIRKAQTTDNFRKIGDERKVTKHIITVTNLEPNQNYEYEIASRDLAGNLMTWPTSNGAGTLLKFMELRKVAQPPGGGGSFITDQNPDTQQPIIIEGPSVVAKTANSITVQWKTDERSDSFVDYGFTTVYGSIKGEATDVTIHSITLTNLTASAVYNFRVSSTDVDNNGPTLSGNAAVSTEAEADQTPPKITAGPIVESITDDQATIIWETDELSDTYIEFGTTTDYGSVRISTEDVKVHSITLTNLSSAATYHFRVSSTDISDNGPTTSADVAFDTEDSPDLTLPVISNVTYSAVTDKTAAIIFTTDELGDTFVDYGILSTAEFKVGNAQDVLEHEITLTNLMPDTTYQFTVGSLDKSDNHSAPSPDFSFKTAAAPDTEAPAIPAGFAGVEGNAQILVMWNPNTEEDLAGYNIYRKAGDDTTLIATLVADTFYNDNGLTNGAIYDYFISAADNQAPYNESSTTSIVSLTPDESNSPSTPAQFFPSESQRIRHDAINMSVENSTPPAGRSLTYEFVIAEEQDFFNQVDFGENIAEGSTYTIWFSGQELTHNQTYYWKARAYDGYFYSVWSGARSFVADTTVATNVSLVDFWGEDKEGVVALGWLTSRETDNTGFNIYRSLNKNEEFEKINENLINCKDGMYDYTDTEVETGRYYYYWLESVSTIGFAEKLGVIGVEVTTPRAFELYQNYPNPFNPTTTIKFNLPKQERVRIKIYNILGQEVKELFDERKEAGYHSIMWDGRDSFERPVASGMYIYRIIAGEFIQAKKMLLIR